MHVISGSTCVQNSSSYREHLPVTSNLCNILISRKNEMQQNTNSIISYFCYNNHHENKLMGLEPWKYQTPS